jgi:hypothetical protein
VTCNRQASACINESKAKKDDSPTLRSATGIDYESGDSSVEKEGSNCVVMSANGLCIEEEGEE